MDAGLNKVLTVVNEEFAKLPDHDQLIGKFEQKMRQMVVSPPTGDLEITTGRVFSAEEARTVLLQPSPAHAACYARVFAASIAAPADSSLHKTRTLLLTLHYLVHRKSWTFMADFVLADGLFALADLVFDSNLYERSQAMEIFLSATDCDVFDWFILPSDPVTQQLHGKLLAVGRQTRLLENLAANRLHSYPGGGFRALQVLAFWLSWVRALHTPGQVLTLPLQLQEDLRQWASRTDHEDPGDGDHSGVDETKLARTLFDDFCVAKPEIFETCGEEQTDPPTAAEESPKDMVVRLKYEGNVLFKQGDCSTAADLYKRALQLLKQGSPNDADRSTMVTLLTNAANAQWQVYRVSRTADILNEVEICCLEAIAMDPCALKAVYRLCHCYLARNEPTKAQQLLEPLVLIRGDEGRPHLNLLRKVYFRCIANSPQRAKNIAIMSPMFVHIYNGLLSRNGMGSSHISLACPSLSEQLHKPSGNVPRDTNTMSLPPSSSVDMLQDMCSQAIKLPVRPKLAESLRKLAKRLLSIAKEYSLLRLVGSNEGYITLNEGLKVSTRSLRVVAVADWQVGN